MKDKKAKKIFGSSKRYNKLDDVTLKEAVELSHAGMAIAWAGGFDAVWASAPDIDGVSQKELFFQNVSRYLPEIEREALRRKLHVK